MRFLTSGESHGPALTAIIEGVPAGLKLTEDQINLQLSRRQRGYGRGGRMKIEQDKVRILGGVRGGFTLGSPVTLMLENKDWPNWEEFMTPEVGANLAERRVNRPRPGHADLSGALKYHQEDIRNILERASARETAMRVAVGAVARELLRLLGVRIYGHVLNIGGVEYEPEQLDSGFWARVEDSEVSCGDPVIGAKMMTVIDQAKQQGESLGGIVEIRVEGLPAGLGSHVQWDRKLDGRLAQALLSIQAIKGVEVGCGFKAGSLPGSQVHDEIAWSKERGYYRMTNRAGGIEGGMTNGEPVVLRAVMKPIPTLYSPLASVDMDSKESIKASVERSDVCAVPAAAVVAEGACAWEIANAFLEKFPSDHTEDLTAAANSYAEYVRKR